MERFGLTCLCNLFHIPPRLHTANDCAKPHFTCAFGRMNVRTGSDIFYEANKMCQNAVIHQRIEQILQERRKSSLHLCLSGFTFSFPTVQFRCSLASNHCRPVAGDTHLSYVMCFVFTCQHVIDLLCM